MAKKRKSLANKNTKRTATKTSETSKSSNRTPKTTPKTPISIKKKTNPLKTKYRSNLDALVQLFGRLELNDKQIKNLKDYCPFYSLCRAVVLWHIQINECRKSDKVVFEKLKKFSKKRQVLSIGSQNLHIRRNDLRDIFGIFDVGENKIEVAEGRDVEAYRPFIRSYFPGIIYMTKTSIESALATAATGETDEHVADVTRLMTLFLLNTLFLSTESWVGLPEVYNWGCGTIENL